MSVQAVLSPQYGARRRAFIIAAVAVSASLAGLFFYRDRLGATAGATANTATEINDKVSALIVSPRTIELTSEKAIRARDAIRQGNYSTADRITASVLANSRIENWRFYPFPDFVGNLMDLNDPAFEAKLDSWVARNRDDATPLLVRAKYYHDIGWLKRGHKFSGETPAASMEEFRDWMNRALTDVEGAILLDQSNPYSFLLQLTILRGGGVSDEVVSAFKTAISKHPGYYSLYEMMLNMLQPKWGGDISAMYGFVEEYAGQADENSPLKLLYVTLYRDLLETASAPCGNFGSDTEKQTQCAVSSMQATVTRDLEHKVVRALQLYDRTDKYQFGIALQTTLSSMFTMGGGEYYAGALLELAANSMHSNTQLKQEKPGNNNYVIDRMVATSWDAKGFHDNALQKYREAIRDIEATRFPSEEEKLLAVADLYQRMARIYEKLHQHPNMIAYEEAAVALGNKTEDQHYICYGYYQLKEYDNAVRTCAKAIGATGSLPAYYWRGAAHRDKGGADLALQDFAVVADSRNDFRSTAAIDMSMIYFGRNDNKSALDVLNRYSYLYDPEAISRQNVAVSYNNRCYAYMQLGDLEEALTDCTASLKYGTIPDAFRKQQELVKRLSSKETVQ